MTTTALAPLTNRQLARRAELDAIIQQHQSEFFRVAEALHEIKSEMLWRSTHSNFANYCADHLAGVGRLGMPVSDRQVERLTKAGEIFADLSDAEIQPTAESQVRPLTSLDTGDRQAAWDAAVVVSEGKTPTASTVESAAKAVAGKAPAFEKGQKVTVQQGDYAGEEVEVIDVEGVVVTVATSEGPAPLLTTELLAPTADLPRLKPAETAAHPLAEKLEQAEFTITWQSARLNLLEDLLREALSVLPIGDLARRIGAVL
jgi:transcription antitermination factor NusG